MRIILLLLFLLLASRTEAQPAFLVFFDWDQATLTAQGHQTIHQAADAALRLHASVEVNGFTDTSGTAQYNQALSWHRAQVVVAELQHDGVPAASIRWFGQNFLRLPTPDDVREPQNRRVAIVLHMPPSPPPPAPPIVYAPVPIYPPIYPWWGFGYPGWYGFGFGFGRWHGGHHW